MANLSITAANVVVDTAYSYTIDKEKNAGATITAGQVVYKDAADSDKLKLAGAAGTATIAEAYGIALVAASSGQPCAVLRKGVLTIGGTVVVGTRLVLSATTGAMCPEADLLTTEKVTHVGDPITTAKIVCDFTKLLNATGASHA